MARMTVAMFKEGRGDWGEELAARGVYFRIVVNFIHDMSTGTWLACLIVMQTVARMSRGIESNAADVLAVANRNVLWLLIASLAGLALTGSLRLMYWRREAAPHELQRKRLALIVKHVAFIVVYGAGTAYAVALAVRH